MKNIFHSREHKDRFVEAIQGIGKVYDGEFDPEYGAALFLLTSSQSTWNNASAYVHRSHIDFEAMLNEVDFSGGYSVLIQLASNLFNGNTHVDPLELLHLDEKHFKLALSALLLRRYGLRKDEVEA
jgi:hypothetical protein